MDMQNTPFPVEPSLRRGATSHWSAHRRWTWTFIEDLADDVLSLTDVEGNAVGEARLDDYLRAVRTDAGPLSTAYASGWRFFERHPEMLVDFEEPVEAGPDVLQSIPEKLFKPLLWIFIGPHGSGTRLHYDVLDTHAWLAVIQGRKRIALHPPGDLEPAYERHRAEAIDVIRHRHDRGRWRYVELAPGDLLLIPSGWWHEVVNDGMTLGLTRNFATPDVRERVATAARVQGLSSLKNWLEPLAATESQGRG